MSPKKNKYRKEYAIELLRIARGDLESAKALSTAKIGRIENIVYLCQQGIEKALKAVLCHLEMAIVHTHDLDVIITLLPDTYKPPQAHVLGTLSQYATIRRYEEGYEVITAEDITNTLSLGNEIIHWAQGIIK